MRDRVSTWLLAIVAVCAVHPPRAWGQVGDDSGIELFSSVGAGPMWDDESLLGIGGVLGAGVGYRVRRLGVEIVADRRWHDRSFASNVRFTAEATRVTGRILYMFPGGGARPYVGGAAGWAQVHRTSEYPDDCAFGPGGQFRCQGTERFRSTHRPRALAAVAGLRVPVAHGFFLRPELELGLAGEFVTIGGTVAAGWRW